MKFSLLAFFVFFAFFASIHAQSVSAGDCMAEVTRLLGREQHFARSVIFGQPRATDAPLTSVRVDIEGNAWTKTGDNQWKSFAPGFETTTWSDLLLEQRAESPARRGYLEVRRAQTSELIPALLQNLRAFECHARAICERAVQSLTADEDGLLDIAPWGCDVPDELPIAACRIEETSPVAEATDVRADCMRIVDSLVAREADILDAVVAYDAAYRSLLQFAGILERFLTDFRFPLFEPLWQAARSITELQRIYCFTAQCDE